MLTAPLVFASLSAGLLGGVHCIGMCGGIANMLTSAGKAQSKVIPIIPAQTTTSVPWRTPALLHAGRIFTYMLMGALTGSIGALGMRSHPFMPIHTLLYIFGNLALVWLGLRIAGFTPHFAPLDRLLTRITSHIHLSPHFSILKQTQRYPFLVGMLWGCLPCGLIFGVLPFALLSGEAYSGAFLMLIFGLGALPHLLFAQAISHWQHHSRTPAVLKITGSSLLIGIGLLGLWWSFDTTAMPAFLCITPSR